MILLRLLLRPPPLAPPSKGARAPQRSSQVIHLKDVEEEKKTKKNCFRFSLSKPFFSKGAKHLLVRVPPKVAKVLVGLPPCTELGVARRERCCLICLKASVERAQCELSEGKRFRIDLRDGARWIIVN